MEVTDLHATPADAIRAMSPAEWADFQKRVRRLAHRKWPGIVAATNGAYSPDDIAAEAVKRVLRGRITWGDLAKRSGSPEAKLYSVMFYQIRKVGTKWYRDSGRPLIWPDGPERDDPGEDGIDTAEHRIMLENACSDDADALQLALYYLEGRPKERRHVAATLGWSPSKVTNTLKRLLRRLGEWRMHDEEE